MKPSRRKHYIEFGISMLLYTVTVLFSVSFVTSNTESTWRTAISLLPVLPSIMLTIAIFRAINRLDELQQQIQLMSFAISFAIVGLTSFAYGFLENVGYPHIPYIWIFPTMIAVWGLSVPFVTKMYQ